MSLSPYFFSPFLTFIKRGEFVKMLSKSLFKSIQIVHSHKNNKLSLREERKRAHKAWSIVRGAGAVVLGSVTALSTLVSFLRFTSWPPQPGYFQCHLQPRYIYPKLLIITLKIPSFTFRLDIMLLSSVARLFKFSHTALRSTNVCLISPWPLFKLVISPLISLRSTLNHSI